MDAASVDDSGMRRRGAGCCFMMSGWIDEMGLVARMLQPFALRALNRETVRHLGTSVDAWTSAIGLNRSLS